MRILVKNITWLYIYSNGLREVKIQCFVTLYGQIRVFYDII